MQDRSSWLRIEAIFKEKKIHGDALQREKSAKTKQKNLVANL